MKKLTFALLMGAICTLGSCTQRDLAALPHNQGTSITPTPAEMTLGEGRMELNAGTRFVAEGPVARAVADFFASRIARSTGWSLAIEEQKPATGYIALVLNPEAPLTDEGYALDVTPTGVDITARTSAGLFYAMQSLMQLLPAEIESRAVEKNALWTIPAVSIRDEPRFEWRGMHLDVCRHFADVAFIKKQLDALAMFKINKFHWHLTEDQGWRIEIKKYPRLNEVGARRVEGEGNEYGPLFYTQEEVREVVAYARERHIEVIPEIELPGHAVAAIAAYPELSCRGVEIPVRNIWGIATDVYCAGNDEVFEFLEGVMEEVIPLFESEYFHIGGDECPKDRWHECPKCQARIKALGLKASEGHTAEEKLQSYFVQRIEKFLVAHGKKMIGWDEILEGGLAPSATVMSWRGEEGGIASANMGHDVVMTPGAWMYFDKYQGSDKLLPVTIGGYLPLAKVYSYEPVPAAITPDKRHHILGAQANVWTEYKYNGGDMEHDIWPRIIAVAEIGWSPAERKNYADFERRIESARVRLDGHDINYYIPLPEQAGEPSCNHVAFTDSTTLEFTTTEPVRMIYTTDGSEPRAGSAEYTAPLTFTESTTLKIRSVVLSGKMGPVRTIEIEKQSLSPAVEGATGGLKAEYYKGYCLTLAELEPAGTDDETETIAAPHDARHRVGGYREFGPDDYWSTVLSGYVNIPADGVYYFSTDGELWIDGNHLISNEKDNHGTARRFSRSDHSVALAAGPHEFRLVRLGAIFGGFPTQWESLGVQIRPEGEADFRPMDASWF